jgi:hypothetical protein
MDRPHPAVPGEIRVAVRTDQTSNFPGHATAIDRHQADTVPGQVVAPAALNHYSDVIEPELTGKARGPAGHHGRE